MIANNPRLDEHSTQNNRRRAAEAGRQQAVLARIALRALQDQPPAPHHDRWIVALRHRIDNPDGALADLGQSMTPPMTKDAYAALLRRALRGGGVGGGQDSANRVSR